MTGNSPENEAGIDGHENRTEDYCKTTDRPISEEEIGEAIRHLKKNKASGWDGIPWEVVKRVDVILFLKQYLNALLDSGYFSEFWSKCIIVPVYKKGGEDSPGNYRWVST